MVRRGIRALPRHGRAGAVGNHRHAPIRVYGPCIDVVHDTRHEGDVVNTLLEQLETGNNMYDGYISESDLIGTHFRHDYVYPLSDYIDGEGQNVTLPTLDLPDFIGNGQRSPIGAYRRYQLGGSGRVILCLLGGTLLH